jgi:predicted cupin superfamily sugar epimerase
MIRRLSAAAAALLIALPLAAQAPDGWLTRVDRSTDAADPDDVPEVTIRPAADGFEVHTGPAVTLYNPANTATGQYTLEGSFTLLQPSGHVNYYGLVYGGRNLEAANQSYIYFLVAQNGSFTIRHRAGDETVHDIVGRTENAAVVQPDANGQSVNRLQVRVGADETQFVVNGTVVHTAARQGMAGASDGIWGLRVNHVIPGVRVEGLRVTPME